MKFMTDEYFEKLAEAHSILTYEKKLEISKSFTPILIKELTEARFKQNPNSDESYSKQAAANCFGTMIAYSAGGNGSYSRKEYQFCRDLFGDDYRISYDLSLSSYDSFCDMMNYYKGNFWTNNLIELSKYMDAQTKKNVAGYMLMFSSVDGEVVSTEKKSIYDFLNRFY